jgi:hypothetical protein
MENLLMVLCDKRQVQTIVEEFEDWKQKPGIELSVLLYGITQKTNDGFILLELKKPLPEGVYMNLVTDDEIVDYVLCTLSAPTTTTPV